MQLKRLSLTQFRIFEQAVFEFQPSMNLLVGINGAGKSTVLDALRIMFSKSLPTLTASKSKRISLNENDILVDRDTLMIELQFNMQERLFNHLVHKSKEKYGISETAASDTSIQFSQQVDRHTRVKRRREQQMAFDLAERDELTSDTSNIPKNLKLLSEQPIVVYFSTHRSLPIMTAPSKSRVSGGQSSAFADALEHRELRLKEFADWWLVQEELASDQEKPRFERNLRVLGNTIMHFLDDCTNIYAIREPETTLMVVKEGKSLDLRQLSDGERSMISLVLDLSRRLAIANPKLADPLRDGKAVVLIDELDLHLHPRWQREIVDKLTRTFPNCQFIATTHSPQIVGEVSPENIIMIEDGRAFRPDQSLGMDTNWILRHLMGVDERDSDTKAKLTKIEELIESEQYDQATAEIDRLRLTVGEFPELVDLQTRIDVIMFLDNEFDVEEEEFDA